MHKLGHDKQKLLKNEDGLGNWPFIRIQTIIKEEYDNGYKLDSFEPDQVDYEIEEIESFIISEKIAKQNGQIYTLQIFQPEVDDDLLWD